MAASPVAALMAGLKALTSASSAASWMPWTMLSWSAVTAARLLVSMGAKRALAWASAVPALPELIWKSL